MPEQWRKAIVVPLHKGKWSQSYCNSYMRVGLPSVPRKVYGRVLNKRTMNITEGSIDTEQGRFRRGRGCMDQIFALKKIVEKYLEKDRKLFAAHMDLEKAYDKS